MRTLQGGTRPSIASGASLETGRHAQPPATGAPRPGGAGSGLSPEMVANVVPDLQRKLEPATLNDVPSRQPQQREDRPPPPGPCKLTSGLTKFWREIQIWFICLQSPRAAEGSGSVFYLWESVLDGRSGM